MSQNIYISVDRASLNDYKDYIDMLCNIVVNGGIKTDKDYIAVLSIIEPFLDVDEEGALKVMQIDIKLMTHKNIIKQILFYIKQIIKYMNEIQGDNYSEAYFRFCNYLSMKKYSKIYAHEFIERKARKRIQIQTILFQIQIRSILLWILKQFAGCTDEVCL